MPLMPQVRVPDHGVPAVGAAVQAHGVHRQVASLHARSELRLGSRHRAGLRAGGVCADANAHTRARVCVRGVGVRVCVHVRVWLRVCVRVGGLCVCVSERAWMSYFMHARWQL